MIYTDEQRFIINEAVKWYYHGSDQVFQFTGGPGTGKSVVLNGIISAIGLPLDRVAPMSYVGAAAIVMRTKGLHNARTIHSWLLSPTTEYKLDKVGNIIMDDYLNRPKTEPGFVSKPLEGKDIIAIDEGGETPYSLKYEIESRGKKIIVCGDLDQLLPVADRPAYLFEGKVYHLTKPMRQTANSGKMYLAERAKRGLPIHEGFYGDALVINEDDLTDEMILKSDIVICGKNSTRDFINRKVRHELLGITSDLPMYKERMICRKNNWNIEVDGINLANGLIGSVCNMPDVGGFDNKTYKIDFQPNMINNHFKSLACDYIYLIAPYKERQQIKNSRYNIGEKMEFAYGITTHLSQGSEFYSGVYIQEFLSKEIQNRLDYTGITRFSGFLIFVKRKRKFY